MPCGTTSYCCYRMKYCQPVSTDMDNLEPVSHISFKCRDYSLRYPASSSRDSRCTSSFKCSATRYSPVSSDIFGEEEEGSPDEFLPARAPATAFGIHSWPDLPETTRSDQLGWGLARKRHRKSQIGLDRAQSGIGPDAKAPFDYPFRSRKARSGLHLSNLCNPGCLESR